MDVILAGAVFLVAYGLIASERVDRTLVALGRRHDQEEAFAAIDFNVIFLLAGMMVWRRLEDRLLRVLRVASTSRAASRSDC